MCIPSRATPDDVVTGRERNLAYKEGFGQIPDAYETLLSDVLTGDQTLFVHAEETEASWRLYTPLLGRDLPLHAYPSGTWGPESAERLLGESGHRWEGPIDTGG